MEAGPKQAAAPVGSAGSQQQQPQSQQQQQLLDDMVETGPVDDGILLARVHVPELCVSKCLQFPKDQLVWDVKQQCLASLPKVATWYRELKESFNYGLFYPPVNGKAGKFLDEERRLGDYPFNGRVGYLELKYKRRVYKMLHLDEKQLKAMHTRTNLRRLLDYVANSQVEKIAKMCGKGLDPNFHCQDTGETPLTLATTLKKPSKVIIALVNGGALLDYRTKEGLTAMHRAVERNNLEAVKTLLELGASPNYKDTKGLTPLYYSVIYKTDPMLCETLLHDHATIGAQDLQGWQEVHQACRNNLVQHLDHLLFYGADMNARNASGNTPLHVCAVNNTDSSCIRQLLFRGAQKDALNYANQTPYQVAVIAGNMELADVIKNYQPDEVVPFKGPPRYNPKRRSVAFGGLSTSCSAGNLGLGTLTRLPSGDYHQPLTPSSPVGMSTSLISSSGSSSSGSASNTLTREHFGPSNPSRVVSSADAYLASGSLGRGMSSTPTTPAENQPQQHHHHGTMSRAESHHGCLNRVPSIEKQGSSSGAGSGSTGSAAASSSSNTNTIQRNPSEQQHQQQQRLSSEYQSPAQLREHARLSSSGEHYQNVRIEGLTRLQEHRIELQHRLDIQGGGGGGGLGGLRPLEMPPSPSPSSRSLAPFSSASSSLSEGSNQPSGEDSASIVTDKSLGDTASDVISDSSGVGTSQSDTTNNSLSIPGTTVVCVEPYSAGIPGHLAINQGDILEVTGATDCGLLEGVLRGQGTGLFPAHCVQEVRLRHTNIPLGPQAVAREVAAAAAASRNRVLGRRESQHKYFATAPRLKKPFHAYDSRVTTEPRTVVLHRSRKGFGFVLRGAKSTTNLTEVTLSARYPALQYLDDVDEGGVADLAGLRKGDFLIQINGEDVTTALHEHVVDLIRKSGELVRMTVVSPVLSLPNSQLAAALPTSQPIQRQYATLPRKTNNSVVIGGTLGRSPAPMPPRRDPKTTLSVGRARARSMVAGLEGGGEKDDRDEMSSNCAKSNSSESLHLNQPTTPGGNANQNSSSQPRTASIRSRPTSSRITAAELEELFQRQQGANGAASSMSSAMSPSHYGSTMQMNSSSHFPSGTISTKSHSTSPAKSGRVYASVAEMKRKGKSSRVRFFGGLGGGSELHRDFHSTPDLNVQAQIGVGGGAASLFPKGHRSQEDVNAALGRNGLPPPNHPPPPPPVGQVVKVNVGAPVPDVVTPASVYDNMAHIQQVKELAAATAENNYGVMSSFRPSNSAKLYASPEDMKTVGYRSLSLPSHSTRSQLRKSHSLRTPNGAGSAATFKPGPGNQLANGASQANGVATAATAGGNGNNNNQYAQPLKNGRSHSTVGIMRERKKKSSLTTSSSASNLSGVSGGNNPNGGASAPPIPEPDYSLSESENDEDLTDEGDESEIAKELEKAAQREKLESTRETSGNSNASAGSGSSSSSSGSGSLPHSFSVEEIQNVRKQLKTQQSLVEDGDNSSSGVSSDQDVPVGPPTGFDDTKARNNEANHHQHQHVHNQAHADKENNSVMVVSSGCAQKRASYGGSGLLTRHAVSLAQLPPPIEADAEEQGNDLFVPPPPEFNADGTPITGTGADELVFAPPPQFCDNGKIQPQQQQQQRVKIIGAIPKAQSNNNQVKPPSGRLHSQ
ncbi:SH3 and multiple ankyrin repeat domains protein 1 isoform X3 [Nasonia vitripennis]|uniref:SH3 and multiple ankyrin repeat domains protein 3 n=1 Tax=Nasonia vitripennis TaxID=7425 RepID=A0A7M7M6V6_NASVI|nr:SH3 and multiple ankyrin repeat domains protein 1 isoform X3 [Nasonia vitripennis]